MDDSQKRAVIVIGDEVRRTLFPGRPAIGETILLNGVQFTVIGTLQKIGHGDNMNLNLRSFVPFHAMQDNFRAAECRNRDRRDLVHQLPAEIAGPARAGASGSAQGHRPESLALIRALPTLSTNGTPSTRWTRSARFSTR